MSCDQYHKFGHTIEALREKVHQLALELLGKYSLNNTPQQPLHKQGRLPSSQTPCHGPWPPILVGLHLTRLPSLIAVALMALQNLEPFCLWAVWSQHCLPTKGSCLDLGSGPFSGCNGASHIYGVQLTRRTNIFCGISLINVIQPVRNSCQRPALTLGLTHRWDPVARFDEIQPTTLSITSDEILLVNGSHWRPTVTLCLITETAGRPSPAALIVGDLCGCKRCLSEGIRDVIVNSNVNVFNILHWVEYLSLDLFPRWGM